jgi:hypothetical protein
VAITATSLSNASISGSTTVSIASSVVSIAISPASVQLKTGTQQQFAAKVAGSTNTTVQWSLSGYGCAGVAQLHPEGSTQPPPLCRVPRSFSSRRPLTLIRPSQAWRR